MHWPGDASSSLLNFMYLYNFGCAGSLWACRGYPLVAAGSHRGGFSCCVLGCMGFRNCGAWLVACAIVPDQRSYLCILHHWATREAQYSYKDKSPSSLWEDGIGMKIREDDSVIPKLLLQWNILSLHLYAPQNWLAMETQDSSSLPVCLLSAWEHILA